MTKEISKDVRAKVFALYLGADIDVGEGHTATLVGAGLDNFNTIEHSVGSYGTHPYNGRDKLILSDLSAISDEDSIELAKIAGVIPKGVNARVYKNTFGEPVVSWGETHYAKYRIPIKEPHLFNGAQYDFLRNPNKPSGNAYMLPAFGITDLFEAGIAVRKNKEV